MSASVRIVAPKSAGTFGLGTLVEEREQRDINVYNRERSAELNRETDTVFCLTGTYVVCVIGFFALVIYLVKSSASRCC